MNHGATERTEKKRVAKLPKNLLRVLRGEIERSAGFARGKRFMDTHRDGKSRDIGSAYHRSDPRHIAELTEVGRGTPMGELMRRYWHPVGLASHATATPRDVRVLGEDLILFRDGRGRAGLAWARW